MINSESQGGGIQDVRKFFLAFTLLYSDNMFVDARLLDERVQDVENTV